MKNKNILIDIINSSEDIEEFTKLELTKNVEREKLNFTPHIHLLLFLVTSETNSLDIVTLDKNMQAKLNQLEQDLFNLLVNRGV